MISIKFSQLIKAVSVSLQDLTHRIADLNATIAILGNDLYSRDDVIATLRDSNQKLRNNNTKLHASLNVADTALCSDNLIFSGLTLMQL